MPFTVSSKSNVINNVLIYVMRRNGGVSYCLEWHALESKREAEDDDHNPINSNIGDNDHTETGICDIENLEKEKTDRQLDQED